MEFKDWQLPIIELLTSDKITEANPLRVLYALDYTLEAGSKIGRSSVQVFLKGLADAGLANRREQPARGGYHGVYWKNDALVEFVARNLKREIVCSECGKTHWLPEKNRDGKTYGFLRCNCGHENTIQSFKGSTNDE